VSPDDDEEIDDEEMKVEENPKGKFFYKMRKLLDEAGIVDWSFVGFDLIDERYVSIHIGAEGESLSNRNRFRNIIGAMKEQSHSLLHDPDTGAVID